MNKTIIFYTMLLLMIKYIYNKYNLELIQTDYDKKVKLLNNHIIYNHKPTIWIHIPNELNSRKWVSFGSRTSRNLNIPFVNLCIDSIIKNCEKDFNIVILKDESFKDYIPDWEYDIEKAPIVEKKKLRRLGLLKIIYYYGGIIVPPSFKCEKSLIDFNNDTFSFELDNRSITNSTNTFLPTLDFMGASKNNHVIHNLIEKYVSIENKINNSIGHVLEKNLTVVDGRLIGVKTTDNKSVCIDDYFNEPNLFEVGERYGVLLPLDDLMSKSKYSWFCRMNKEQLGKSDLYISKVLV